MKDLEIFGGNGQHALDLKNRGVFNGFNTTSIDKSEGEENDFSDKAIITPIAATKELIERIIKIDQLGSIINFSGIMSTTPKEIQDRSSNMHFLFGPGAERNLKCIVAGELSESTLKIIDNSRQKGIKIIESSIEEHDKKMAIVQGLTHLFILLSGINASGTSRIIKEWNTPTGTITQMIFDNPQFGNIRDQFIGNLDQNTNISSHFLDTVELGLTGEEINNFGTPTFRRIIKFCKTNNIFTNSEMLEFINNQLRNREKVSAQIDNVKRKEKFKRFIDKNLFEKIRGNQNNDNLLEKQISNMLDGQIFQQQSI